MTSHAARRTLNPTTSFLYHIAIPRYPRCLDMETWTAVFRTTDSGLENPRFPFFRFLSVIVLSRPSLFLLGGGVAFFFCSVPSLDSDLGSAYCSFPCVSSIIPAIAPLLFLDSTNHFPFLDVFFLFLSVVPALFGGL